MISSYGTVRYGVEYLLISTVYSDLDEVDWGTCD